MTNKHQVVLVPTKNESNIAFYQEGTSYNKPVLQIVKYTSSDYTYQHIHIFSNEKPNKCDWIYNPIYKTVYQWIKNAEINFDRIDAKKIVASTDASLGVPLVHESFIKHYITQYNLGNVITEVDVEYKILTTEEWIGDNYNDEPIEVTDLILTVNSDNTINIIVPSVDSLEDAAIKEYPLLGNNYLYASTSQSAFIKGGNYVYEKLQPLVDSHKELLKIVNNILYFHSNIQTLDKEFKTLGNTPIFKVAKAAIEKAQQLTNK